MQLNQKHIKIMYTFLQNYFFLLLNPEYLNILIQKISDFFS